MRIVAENSDGSIEVLIPERFGLEVRLQELLEEHPELVLADLPEEDRHRKRIGGLISRDGHDPICPFLSFQWHSE